MLVFQPVKEGIYPQVIDNAIRLVETDKYYRVYFDPASQTISVSTIFNKADYTLQILRRNTNVKA